MPSFNLDPITGRIPDLEDGIRFPAVDREVTDEICAALIAGAPSSLGTLADAIREVDDGTDWKIRFLLHALATFVSHPSRPDERGALQRGYLALLKEEGRPSYRKTVIVSQVQLCGDAAALPALAALLVEEEDPRLVDAAAAAVVAIGGDARKILRGAMERADGRARDAVENALKQVG